LIHWINGGQRAVVADLFPCMASPGLLGKIGFRQRGTLHHFNRTAMRRRRRHFLLFLLFSEMRERPQWIGCDLLVDCWC
jgi:hypothetical protein